VNCVAQYVGMKNNTFNLRHKHTSSRQNYVSSEAHSYGVEAQSAAHSYGG